MAASEMRVAAVLCILAAVAAGEDWLYPRCDLERTGVTKNQGPKTKPQVAWQREESGPIGTGAALTGGRLIYGAGEFVVACRRQRDGGEVWDAAVKQQVVSWPLVLENLVFFGGQDRVHYRINLSDGKEPASAEAEASIVADPAVTADYYVAGAEDGFLYAMGTSSGRVLWRQKTGPVRHGAVVAKGRVYVASEEGVLFAFDLKRGRELWKYAAGEPLVAAPILGKGMVYLPLPDHVEEVDAKRGESVRRLTTPGIAGPPALEKRLLHYGTKEGEVVTLELSSSREKARIKVADQPVSTPIVCARKILFGAAGSVLFACDPAARKVLWTYEGEEPFKPLIVANKSIYVGAGTIFYCLR